MKSYICNDIYVSTIMIIFMKNTAKTTIERQHSKLAIKMSLNYLLLQFSISIIITKITAINSCMPLLPQAEDGGDGRQIWRVAVNILQYCSRGQPMGGSPTLHSRKRISILRNVTQESNWIRLGQGRDQWRDPGVFIRLKFD